MRKMKAGTSRAIQYALLVVLALVTAAAVYMAFSTNGTGQKVFPDHKPIPARL